GAFEVMLIPQSGDDFETPRFAAWSRSCEHLMQMKLRAKSISIGIATGGPGFASCHSKLFEVIRASGVTRAWRHAEARMKLECSREFPIGLDCPISIIGILRLHLLDLRFAAAFRRQIDFERWHRSSTDRVSCLHVGFSLLERNG